MASEPLYEAPTYVRSTVKRHLELRNNLVINDKTTGAAVEAAFPFTSVIAWTFSIADGGLAPNGTCLRHMDDNPTRSGASTLELCLLFLQIAETAIYLDEESSHLKVPGVGLKPIRRGVGDPLSDSSDEEDEDDADIDAVLNGEEDPHAKLLQMCDQINDEVVAPANPASGASSSSSRGGSEAFTEEVADNPLQDIPRDMSTVRFYIETVMSDPVDTPVGHKKLKNRDLFTLFTEWADSIPDRDVEAARAARSALNEMRKRFSFLSELSVPDDEEMATGQYKTVDSVTMYFFLNSRHDLTGILNMILKQNRDERVLSHLSQVSISVARATEKAKFVAEKMTEEGGGAAQEGQEYLYGKEGYQQQQQKKGGRGGGSAFGKQGKSRFLEPGSGLKVAGLDIHKLSLLEGLYVDDKKSWDDCLEHRVGYNDIRDRRNRKLTPEVMFSVTNAINKRGYRCDEKQSVRYYLDNRGEVYDGTRYDPNGMRMFRFPHPERVVRIVPARVTVNVLLSQKLPHAQRSISHPLISGQETVYTEAELRDTTVVGIRPQYSSRYREYERQMQEGRPRSAAMVECERAATKLREELYDDNDIEYESRANISRQRNPFDADLLHTVLPFDERRARGDPHVTRGGMANNEILVDEIRQCNALVLPKIAQIKGVKRRRALRIAVERYVIEKMCANRSHHFANAPALKATYYAINEKGLYEKPVMHVHRISDDLCPTSNFVATLVMLNSQVLTAADPQVLGMLQITSLNSSNQKFNDGCMGKLICGVGGTGKSWLMAQLDRGRISFFGLEMTTTEMTTSFSSMAFNSDCRYLFDLTLFIMNETPMKLLISDDEGGSADQQLKERAEEGRVSRLVFEFDKDTGDRVARRITNDTRGTSFLLVNSDISQAGQAILQRLPPVYTWDMKFAANDVPAKVLQAAFKKYVDHKDATKENLYHMLQVIQAFTTEMNVFFAATDWETAPENSASLLILTEVGEYLATHGSTGFQTRAIRGLDKFAAILCVVGWFSAEYLTAGGRHFGEAFHPRHIHDALPSLVVTPEHVILSLGLNAPYYFTQGEQEIRTAFLWQMRSRIDKFKADTRKRRNDDCTDNPVDVVTLVRSLTPIRDFSRSGTGSSEGSGLSEDILSLDSHDLNYVVFKYAGNFKAMADRIGTWLDAIEAVTKKPPPNATGHALKRFCTTTISGFPMRLGTSLDEPLVPDTRAGVKAVSLPIVKISPSRKVIYVNMTFLLRDKTGMTLVEDAIKSVFNNVNERPRRVLFKEGVGPTLDAMWIGQGYKVGTVEKEDRDMSPITNPKAFQPRVKPAVCENTVPTDIVYKDTAGFEDGANKLVDAWGDKRQPTARVKYFKTSLEAYAFNKRRKNLDIGPEPVSEEDVAAAIGYFSAWCRGDYSSEGDEERFGREDAEEEDEEMGEPEEAAAPTATIISSDSVSSLRISHSHLDETARTGWDDSDTPDPEAGGGCFASVGELSMSAFEENSDTSSRSLPGVMTSHQLEKTGGLSVAMYNKRRAEKATRKLVLFQDLEEDVDCPPEQYLVENIWHRSDIPDHPITNAPLVPLWVADDSLENRAQFKMRRQGTTWDVSRRHGAADPVGTKPFYPDHYQSLYRQNVAIREAKIHEAQRAAETSTSTSGKQQKKRKRKNTSKHPAGCYVPDSTKVHRAFKEHRRAESRATPPPPPRRPNKRKAGAAGGARTAKRVRRE